MLICKVISIALLAGTQSTAVAVNAAAGVSHYDDNRLLAERQQGYGKIAPKIVIVSMVSPEANSSFLTATVHASELG